MLQELRPAGRSSTCPNPESCQMLSYFLMDVSSLSVAHRLVWPAMEMYVTTVGMDTSTHVDHRFNRLQTELANRTLIIQHFNLSCTTHLLPQEVDFPPPA